MRTFIPKGTCWFHVARTRKTKRYFIVAMDKNGRELGRVFPAEPGTPSRMKYTDREFATKLAASLNAVFQAGRRLGHAESTELTTRI